MKYVQINFFSWHNIPRQRGEICVSIFFFLFNLNSPSLIFQVMRILCLKMKVIWEALKNAILCTIFLNIEKTAWLNVYFLEHVRMNNFIKISLLLFNCLVVCCVYVREKSFQTLQDLFVYIQYAHVLSWSRMGQSKYFDNVK